MSHVVKPTRSVARKALRIIWQERVHLIAAGPLGFVAEVVGDHGDTYTVQWDPEHGPDCECEFLQYQRKRPCSHLVAAIKTWRAFYPKEGKHEQGAG